MSRKQHRQVVCVDLDGTLSDDENRRQQYAPPAGSPLDLWLQYHLACGQDGPIAGTIGFLKALAPYFQIHIISGRWEQMRVVTEKWLQAQGVPYQELRMYTPADAPTKNYVFKVSYIEELRARNLEPVLFIENEPACAAYIETHATLPVLCVANATMVAA
jgi:uncharacterized HAD superfamily protein